MWVYHPLHCIPAYSKDGPCLPVETGSLYFFATSDRFGRDPSVPRLLFSLLLIRVLCKCVKLQCGGLRAVPGAHRPCAPSGSAVETKRQREKKDVELTCSMTVHLQRLIPS